MGFSGSFLKFLMVFGWIFRLNFLMEFLGGFFGWIFSNFLVDFLKLWRVFGWIFGCLMLAQWNWGFFEFFKMCVERVRLHNLDSFNYFLHWILNFCLNLFSIFHRKRRYEWWHRIGAQWLHAGNAPELWRAHPGSGRDSQSLPRRTKQSPSATQQRHVHRSEHRRWSDLLQFPPTQCAKHTTKEPDFLPRVPRRHFVRRLESRLDIRHVSSPLESQSTCRPFDWHGDRGIAGRGWETAAADDEAAVVVCRHSAAGALPLEHRAELCRFATHWVRVFKSLSQ